MATYIIRAGDTDAVKIGKADDPERRLPELQTGHHETLTLVRVIDTPFDAEPQFHARFADRRLRGEWFTFCDEMLTFIPVAPDGNYASATLPDLLKKMGQKAVAARLGISPRTVDNWIAGDNGPAWRHVVGMLNDAELAPPLLEAAGRGDLAKHQETIAALKAALIAEGK